MARMAVTAAMSTVEGIVLRYDLAVQAARMVSDRSIPNDQCNKRTIYLKSPDHKSQCRDTYSRINRSRCIILFFSL